VTFFAYSSLNTLQKIVIQQQSIDISSDDLSAIAQQAYAFDKDISIFLNNLDTLLTSYQNGQNIFLEQSDTVNQVRAYIAINKDKLTKR
jgi:hypothetical protein